jgi:hypothetical protein
MKRRRRKNPGGTTLLVVGGVLAAAVVGYMVFFNKKPIRADALPAARIPEFTGGLPNAEGLLEGDCLVAVQGQAGFSVGAGVPMGENTTMQITSSGGKSATSVTAVSIDPRVANRSPLVVPTRAISGGGDCAAI